MHTNAGDYAAGLVAGGDAVVAARTREFLSTVFKTEHPAVRVHPETAERSLLLLRRFRRTGDSVTGGLASIDMQDLAGDVGR